MKLILYNIYKEYVQETNKKTFFYLTFRYRDDVLSNPKFNDYIDVIYPEELEIKDITYASKWANYLNLHQEFDEDGKLYTRLYDNRDDRFP